MRLRSELGLRFSFFFLFLFFCCCGGVAQGSFPIEVLGLCGWCVVHEMKIYIYIYIGCIKLDVSNTTPIIIQLPKPYAQSFSCYQLTNSLWGFI